MSAKHPKIIKRYQNRKLYDTADSCYVTLEEIADMIKMGEEVQVIDNASKEDLTAVTLAQIIFEEQKHKRNAFPLAMFTDIIKGSGDTIRDFVTKTIETGVREIDHVREFVDEKVRPTIENVQNIPTVQSEIKALRQKIETLERKVRETDHHKTPSHSSKHR